MGDGLKRARAAAKATRRPVPWWKGTGAVLLGSVAAVTGEELEVWRRTDGSALLYGDKGTVLAIDRAACDELRELLDRIAMPGQGA